MKVWNMTNGEEYNYDIKSLEEMMNYLSINHTRDVLIHDSLYDHILKKWFYYIRIEDENGAYIYQITE